MEEYLTQTAPPEKIMSLVKILGVMDFVAGIAILLGEFEVIPWRFMLPFLAYLIFKGIAFRGSLTSALDMGIGIYIIVMLFWSSTIISVIAAVYLLQKSISSLVT